MPKPVSITIIIITVVSALVSLPKHLEGSVQHFNGATKFKDRFRTLQLTIMNNLPHSLHRESDGQGTYFNSGDKFTDPPFDIPPYQSISWLVANKQGSFGTGVSGSIKYYIGGLTEDKALYIGFSHPFLGSYKHSIAVKPSINTVEFAYDILDNDDRKQYHQDGYIITAESQISNEGADRHFIFTISEDRHPWIEILIAFFVFALICCCAILLLCKALPWLGLISSEFCE